MKAYQERLWGGPVIVEAKRFGLVRTLKDPRPDLKDDSKDWDKLLNLAMAINESLAYNLEGFRCGGLRLNKTDVGYVLRPEFDPKSSLWKNITEYEKDRGEWLMEYREELINILDRLED